MSGSATREPRHEERIVLREPFKWVRADGLPWIEADLGIATAAFSTRLGGVSRGPFGSLNLGILTDDEPEFVERNRRVLADAIGRAPDAVAMGLQVHGARVRLRMWPLEDAGYVRRGLLEEADGQATTDPQVSPLVLVADCIPLVLAVPGAVATVHCGWRGVVAGVVQEGVTAVCDAVAESAEAITAVLGPGIGPCCYEVGKEVIVAFRARGDGEAVRRGRRLDLPGAVRTELERLGVPASAIHSSGICTSCHSELFFSHRRDGRTTGRQAGIAWLTSP